MRDYIKHYSGTDSELGGIDFIQFWLNFISVAHSSTTTTNKQQKKNSLFVLIDFIIIVLINEQSNKQPTNTAKKV